MIGLGSRWRSLSQRISINGSAVVVVSLLVTGFIIGLRSRGRLAGWELSTFDQMVRSRPDQGLDPRFLVVGITDLDIQKRQEYPITDGTLATLLAKLESQKPRVIGIDILRDVKQGSDKGRKELIRRLSQSDRIVATCEISKSESPGISPAPGIPEDRVGVADFPVDAGGTVRLGILITTPQASKLPAVTQHICNYVNPENQLLSLSFQMVVRYLQAKGIEPQITTSGLKFGSTIIKRLTPDAGGYYHADTRDFRILLNYRSANNAVKQVSLSDVLQNKVDPALIKDKIIMIGYTADIVKDTFYTPYSAGATDSQKMPGVVVHAQNASQILSAVLDHRPLFWYWLKWQEGLWILTWTLVGSILAWRIRRPALLVLSLGVAIAVLVGSCYITLFMFAGWIPIVPPLLGLLASATSIILIDRYAATIVKTVKGLLKINIDIDEDKKQAEVAAITESDYFLDLQQKAKEMRNREKITSKSPFLPSITPQEITVNRYIPTIQPTVPPEEVDYLQQVRDRRNQSKVAENATITKISETTEITSENQPEIEYWQELQRRGKKIKDTNK